MRDRFERLIPAEATVFCVLFLQVLAIVGCPMLAPAAEPIEKPRVTKTITGKVIGVHDGDTITVLDSENMQHKIRLAEIDAPELKQPFGTKSKEALAARVFQERVLITYDTIDRYGRIVGRVDLPSTRKGEAPRWINRDLVAAGWAWRYVTYSKSDEIAAAEKQAREKKRGLWAGEGADTPVPPWEYRRGEKRRDANRAPASTLLPFDVQARPWSTRAVSA